MIVIIRVRVPQAICLRDWLGCVWSIKVPPITIINNKKKKFWNWRIKTFNLLAITCVNEISRCLAIRHMHCFAWAWRSGPIWIVYNRIGQRFLTYFTLWCTTNYTRNTKKDKICTVHLKNFAAHFVPRHSGWESLVWVILWWAYMRRFVYI